MPCFVRTAPQTVEFVHKKAVLKKRRGLAEFERDLIRARTGEGRAPRPCGRGGDAVQAIFKMVERRAFKKSDFGVFPKETIGLLPPLARDVAEVSIAATPLREMVRVVDWLTRLI